jgi:hypothetical protein
MSAHCRLIDKEQLSIRRPLRQQSGQIGREGRLLRRLRLQVVVAQPTQATPQGMQDLVDLFPAVFNAKTGGKAVLHQFGGPQTHIVPYIARTMVDDLLDLRPLCSSQSRGRPGIGVDFNPGSPSR